MRHMQHPLRLTSTPKLHLHPSPPRQRRTIILILQVIRKVTRSIKLRMANTIAEEFKSIAGVPELPVLAAKFLHSLEVVQCAAGPEGGYAAGDGVAFVPGAACVGVNGARHELCNVCGELGLGGGGGVERMDWFGAVAVEGTDNVVCLCLCAQLAREISVG
jgi:hypothetical protein